ncbi:MAG: helix-turn-helix domain-containing protein [Oscillospiraceae bacterium]|nr:helix-turn-helix domain-containing protein [Oscillospiraceae bacterium]
MKPKVMLVYENYQVDNLYLQQPLDYEGIFVAQLGRLYCKSGLEIHPHVHTELYEITAVTDGEGVIYANGKGTPVQRGDIYLSMPGDVHRICSSLDDPLKFDYFAFYTTEETYRTALDRVAETYHSGDMRVFREERIPPLLANAIGEIGDGDAYAHPLLSAMFRELVIYILRGFRDKRPSFRGENVTRAEILCYRLMNYVDTHLYSMKHLEELSEATGYSYGYLSDLFRKTTGNSLSGYYHAKKLEAARLLLLENKLQVTEIAEMLNYASVYAFSKAFHRQYGVSPRQYRKQL